MKPLRLKDIEIDKKAPEVRKKMMELSIKGYSQYEIIKEMELEFNLNYSWLFRLYKELQPEIKELIHQSRLERLESTILELERWKSEQKGKGDHRLAFEIQKEINKISGLYLERVDLTTNGKSVNNEVKIIFVNGEDESDESLEEDVEF